MKWLEENHFLTDTELEDLELLHRDNTSLLGIRSTTVWTWIGDSMGQVRSVPQVTPPMYVRLLFLCQDCLTQVEELKTNLTVQMPFTYAHMLASLVHMSNILLAISCGLAFGSAVAEVMERHQQLGSGLTIANTRIIGEMYEAAQVMSMQVLMVLVHPLLYQSFLVIAHALCYPYGDDICHMPTETFIHHLHHELQVMAAGKETIKTRDARKKALAGKGSKKKDTDEEEEDDDDDG